MSGLPTQSTEIDAADTVRLLRSEMGLPLRRLSTLAKTTVDAPMICRWENRRISLRPSAQQAILRVVREEFAKHTTRVVRLAHQHGINVDA